MNAVDIPARGLARRALDGGAFLQAQFDLSDEGAAPIEARTEPTAAALEALSADFAMLTGRAGFTHVVETAPYLMRDSLIIRGNGAVLRNTNQTPLTGLADAEQVTLPLGTSNVWGTDSLTYYAIQSNDGAGLAVAPGAGENFAAGNLVIVHGSTHYFVPGDEYNVYRNYTRARVIAATSSTITLDRVLPIELLADAPVIANADEGIEAGFDGPSRFYLLFAPHISGLTLASDVGELMKWGGVIDGSFRDLTLVGRNGITLNALENCEFENIRFRAWRKACELGEGSNRTTIRNLRGSLSDAGAKLNGGSDVPPFFIGINENCAECLIEEVQLDSGPNDAGPYNACQLGSGRDNAIRDFVFRFPMHTGVALAVQANSAPGFEATRLTYAHGQVHAPNCSVFLSCNDGGGGIERPSFIDLRFEGTPTVRAANLAGSNGLMQRVRFASGDVLCTGPMTGWRIEDCEFPGNFNFSATFENNRMVGNYIADGFGNLNDTVMTTNEIRDNDSDANRRSRAAAVIDENQGANIVTQTANAVYRSATFAAGDLEVGDHIFIYSRLRAGGVGSNNRTAAVSVSTPISLRKGCGTRMVATPGSLEIECELVIASNTSINYSTTIGGVPVGPSSAVVDDLTINALTVAVEAWVGTATDPIVPYSCRVIPVKRGMKHLPLR